MMSVKVLWDKATQKILGAQIVGFDGVDKRMDVIATAMRLGAKVTDLAELELCYAPPFGSAKDPVNMVGFVAENVITGKIGQFFWHDVEKLPRDGSVTLLDTRTNTEVARGRIDGFMHIPAFFPEIHGHSVAQCHLVLSELHTDSCRVRLVAVTEVDAVECSADEDAHTALRCKVQSAVHPPFLIFIL